MNTEERNKVIDLLTPAEDAAYACDITLSARTGSIEVSYFPKGAYITFFRSACSMANLCTTWAEDTAATAAKLAPAKTGFIELEDDEK